MHNICADYSAVGSLKITYFVWAEYSLGCIMSFGWMLWIKNITWSTCKITFEKKELAWKTLIILSRVVTCFEGDTSATNFYNQMAYLYTPWFDTHLGFIVGLAETTRPINKSHKLYTFSKKKLNVNWRFDTTLVILFTRDVPYKINTKGERLTNLIFRYFILRLYFIFNLYLYATFTY